MATSGQPAPKRLSDLQAKVRNDLAALKVQPSAAPAAGFRHAQFYAGATDTQPAVELASDMRWKFGAGGAAATDVDFYRESSNGVRLRMSAGLRVDGIGSVGGAMPTGGATRLAAVGPGGDYGQFVTKDSTQAGANCVSGMEALDSGDLRQAVWGAMDGSNQNCIHGAAGGHSFHTGASTNHAHGMASIVRGYVNNIGQWFFGNNIQSIASRNARVAIWNTPYTVQSGVDGTTTSNSAGAWDLLLLRGATDQGLPSGGAYLRVENSSNNRILELTAGGFWQWYNPSTDAAEGAMSRDAANSLKWSRRFVVEGQILGTAANLAAGLRGLDVKGNVTDAYNAAAAVTGQWRIQAPNATNGGHCGITYEDSAGNRVGWMGMVMKASAHDMVIQGYAGGVTYREWARFTSDGHLSLPVAGAQIRAAGGLGVGNSAVASAVGALARVMQVFDASGASLGYVPIYSGFTP